MANRLFTHATRVIDLRELVQKIYHRHRPVGQWRYGRRHAFRCQRTQISAPRPALARFPRKPVAPGGSGGRRSGGGVLAAGDVRSGGRLPASAMRSGGLPPGAARASLPAGAEVQALAVTASLSWGALTRSTSPPTLSTSAVSTCYTDTGTEEATRKPAGLRLGKISSSSCLP